MRNKEGNSHMENFSQSVQFSLRRDKKISFLRSRFFVNVVAVLFILASLLGVLFIDSTWKITFDDVGFGIFYLGCFILASFVFFRRQKAYDYFLVGVSGVEVAGRLYPWEKMRRYHWLGEAQGERIGLGKYYDPVNPYRHTHTQIARIKMKGCFQFPRWLNLEIDQERVKELADLLDRYGITHTSRTRLWIGV